MAMIIVKARFCPATASFAARPSQPCAQQIMSERKRAYQKYGPAACSPYRSCPTCSDSKLRR